jgi:uncharacterized protein YndB with AHSA1/START domain
VATAIAELTVAASPARVWRALEPTGLTGWLCEAAVGELTPGARVELGWPSLGLEAAVDVVEVDPGRRVVLAGTGDAAGERQETTLTDDGGTTRVVVRHDGFGDGERARARAAGTEAGWQVALRVLDLFLGGREDQRLAARAAVGTSAASVEAMWPRLAETLGLARWLGPIEGPLDREGAVGAVTIGGRRTRAIVLGRVPPFELALTLPAYDAVLRARLIDLEGATLVCLQVVGWSPERIDNLAEPLGRALVPLLGRGEDTLA